MRLKLTRPITADEINAYNVAGVVLLRSVLDLATVNLLRRCIDDGIKSLGTSSMAYDLTRYTNAMEARDEDVIAAGDGGQHDVSGLVEFIRMSGKPLLIDKLEEAKRQFLSRYGARQPPRSVSEIDYARAVR